MLTQINLGPVQLLRRIKLGYSVPSGENFRRMAKEGDRKVETLGLRQVHQCLAHAFSPAD